MRGDLSETTVADLCRGLSAAGATGGLEVASPSGEARIFFRSGDVYWALSPTPRARLGDRLVNSGLLSQEDLDEVLEEQRSSSERTKLGALLVERGLVSRDAIRVFVQEQILDALFEVMQWHEGGYVFNAGEVADEKLPIDIPVDQLLVEVSRRQSEWDQIEEAIPDLDMVPDFVTGGSSAHAALEPDEFTVLANVDGGRSIRDLADDLGYSEFEAARIVYGLTLLGIVHVRHADEDESRDETVDVASALEEALAGAAPVLHDEAPTGAVRPRVKLHVDDEVRDYLPPHGPGPVDPAEAPVVEEPEAEEPEPPVEEPEAEEPEPQVEEPEEPEPEPEPEEPEPEPEEPEPAAEEPGPELEPVAELEPDERTPAPGGRSVGDLAAALEASLDDEPEPWVAATDEPTPPDDLGFFAEKPAPAPRRAPDPVLDDDDFDALLSELGSSEPSPIDGGGPARGEAPAATAADDEGERAPADEVADAPAQAAEEDRPADAPEDVPDHTEPATEPATGGRRGGSGDVSEFLRELSQLATDEPPAGANPGPTRPPAPKPTTTEQDETEESPPPSREDERRQAAEKRDDRNKKRGLFGWGR